MIILHDCVRSINPGTRNKHASRKRWVSLWLNIHAFSGPPSPSATRRAAPNSFGMMGVVAWRPSQANPLFSSAYRPYGRSYAPRSLADKVPVATLLDDNNNYEEGTYQANKSKVQYYGIRNTLITWCASNERRLFCMVPR